MRFLNLRELDFSSALFAVHDDADEVHDCAQGADDIGSVPRQVEAYLGVHYVGDGDKGVERAGNERHPYPLGLAVFKHPHSDADECEQCESLVCPCEVAPKDLEACGTGLCPDEDARDECEDNRRQSKALAVGVLLDVQRIGNGHTQCAQRGVAGGYRQNDNAEQSDYAAYRSEDVLADDADGLGSKGCYRLLKAEVVNAHCTGCPYHCYEALKDHHVVEGIASLALALHGAGDDSRLGGMEAGQYAAGDGNEEYREEVTACKILTVVENALIAPDIVPDLDERIALYEQPDENTDSREQQIMPEK